jgi:hypothetical protein
MNEELTSEDYDKIIKALTAANEGKQLKHRWPGDRKYFDRKAWDLRFKDFYKDSIKISDFKEVVPKLSADEYDYIYDALSWLNTHDLGYAATERHIDIKPLLEKIKAVNINTEKGKYTGLIKLIRGMKKGKQYEYLRFNTWEKVTLDMNIYPLMEIIKSGEIRECKK